MLLRPGIREPAVSCVMLFFGAALFLRYQTRRERRGVLSAERVRRLHTLKGLASWVVVVTMLALVPRLYEL